MKKKFLGILLAIVSLFSVSSVSAATVIDAPATNKGIEITASVDPATSENEWIATYSIVYTITEEYDIEANNGQINLNVIDDELRVLEEIDPSLPGDIGKFSVTIINKSNYVFDFDKVIVSTADITGYQNFDKPTVEVFDGNSINIKSSWNANRTGNAALKALGGTSDNYVEEALKNILDEEGNQKYPNGVKDLDKYYLDFYSEQDGVEYTSLKEIIKQTTAGNAIAKETNENIAKAYYEYFYDTLITVLPSNVPVVQSPAQTYEEDYSAKSYMEGTTTELEEQLKEEIGTIEADETKESSFNVVLDGPLTNNAFQSYSYFYNVNYQLQATKGNVIARYVDEDGKELTTEVISSGYINTEYKSEAKEFDGYELIEVKGKETGIYTKEDIVVTYVYQFVLGEGGEEEKEEPTNLVQTGSEVDYSLMTSALITISLMAIALKTKKKNN